MFGGWHVKTETKLAVFDLDGTLFDTREVNFLAYSQAIKEQGIDTKFDFSYYINYCNGRYYKDFLPLIIPNISNEQLSLVHERKKELYLQYVPRAKKNDHLFNMIELIRSEYLIALVTTASRKNVDDILNEFKVRDLFDWIITQEDVINKKPDPECFLVAMDKASVSKENTIIFEDSDTGIEAAARSGAKYMRVFGYQ